MSLYAQWHLLPYDKREDPIYISSACFKIKQIYFPLKEIKVTAGSWKMARF